MAKPPPHPMQPFIRRERDGVMCFKPNRILEWYLNHGRLPLTQIMANPYLVHEDKVQLTQLIGASLSVYSEWYEIISSADLAAAEKAAKKKRQPKRHPMQPLVVDAEGVVRFKENKIVGWLFEPERISLNDVAMNAATRRSFCAREDQEQLAQLIGYSVSGYADLSYVTDRSYSAAVSAAETLTGKKW